MIFLNIFAVYKQNIVTRLSSVTHLTELLNVRGSWEVLVFVLSLD